MPASNDSAWKTLSERTRFISCGLCGLLLAGWGLWFFPFDDLLDRSGTPLGADFTMFYVAGSIVADGSPELLYDQAEHQRRLVSLFPGIDPQFCLPYRYPPLVAILAAPLATLPYAAAYALFTLGSLMAWWGSLLLLAKALPVLRGLHRNWLFWICLTWPVGLETIIGGQASMFALLLSALLILALRRNLPLLAGVALALSIYKPNVLALVAIGVIVCRPSLLRGAVAGAVLLFAVMVAWVGWPVMEAYLHATGELAAGQWTVETPFWKVHSLASWIAVLIPDFHRLVSMALGILAAVAIGRRYRQAPSHDTLALCLLFLVNALFNPYTPIYDLMLLLPAGLLATQYYLVDSDRSRLNCFLPGVYACIGLLYFGPHLSQAVAKAAGWQPFPLLLLTAAVWLSFQLWQLNRPFASRLISLPQAFRRGQP